MATIKAPFNFVPLADKVYTPDRADQISQDIPFSDGVSGYIDLTITAKSPIFIRNGHTKEEADAGKDAVKKAIDEAKHRGNNNPDFSAAKQLRYNSFNKSPDGKYFIPATTVKGEVRSILEILSNSKMKVDRNVRFAQRDWDNKYLYPKLEIQKDLLCGYLKWYENEGVYKITSHGKPKRISHKRIDEYLENVGIGNQIFESHFSESSTFDLTNSIPEGDKSYDPKTARYKYHFLIGDENEQKLLNINFSKDDTSTKYSERLKYDPNGNIKGDIVLTGQPGKWVYPRPDKEEFKKQHPDLQNDKLDARFMKEVQRAGKFYEFVFPETVEGESIEMNEEEFRYFKFIYSESEEWPRVMNLLYSSKGVPVFFRKDKIDGKVVIQDFGLAYMYKIPYDNSPYDLLEGEKGKYYDYKEKYDLSDCIFGFVDTITKEENKRKASIKGRVQFTSFVASSAQEDTPRRIMLLSPKASYYPIYIRQPNNISSLNDYLTYNNGELSGWKRYVVKEKVLKDDNEWGESEKGKDETKTVIFPLKQGTIFRGKIRFFNLRPIELGALISALSFHGTDNCFHLLGQGKPFGLGKTKYEIELYGKGLCSKETYMGYFEKAMMDDTNNKWLESDSIKELISIAKTSVPKDQFDYMILDVKNKVNEFVDAKKTGESLQHFTEIRSMSYVANSYEKCIEDAYIKRTQAEKFWNEIKNRNLSKEGNRDVLRNYLDELEKVKEMYKECALEAKPVIERINETKQKLHVIENPATMEEGSIIKARCDAARKACIEGFDYDIQLNAPEGIPSKLFDFEPYVGKDIKVKVKVISKIGEITQVELVEET